MKTPKAATTPKKVDATFRNFPHVATRVLPCPIIKRYATPFRVFRDTFSRLWMVDWEKQAILDFHHANPLAGYRRLTFMMLDADVVAVSPSSVYRVLRQAGVMDRFNGKIEGYHRTIKGDCIRVKNLESLEDARRVVDQYVVHYNEVRLHSAIGYVTPLTKLVGKEQKVFDSRDRKLETAREARRLRRQQQAAAA